VKTLNAVYHSRWVRERRRRENRGDECCESRKQKRKGILLYRICRRFAQGDLLGCAWEAVHFVKTAVCSTEGGGCADTEKGDGGHINLRCGWLCSSGQLPDHFVCSTGRGVHQFTEGVFWCQQNRAVSISAVCYAAIAVSLCAYRASWARRKLKCTPTRMRAIRAII